MGKATLIMVVGLSIVLGMVGVNLNSKSSSAITNAENYFMDAALFSIKTSGANIAVGQVFRNVTVIDGISIGGSLTVFSGPATMKARGTGTPQNVGDLSVTIFRPFRDSIVVQSIATGSAYDPRGNLTTDRDTTIVGMRRTNFAEYSYFTDHETSSSGSTIWWISGDSVGVNLTDTSNGGKIHTNDDIHIDGNPVFYGKVTTGGGKILDAGSNPVFKGGYESGVTQEMPGDFSLILANATSGFYRNNGREIWLTFSSAGTDQGRMKYHYSTGSDTTINLDGGNGLIVITGAIVHVQGTVDGAITVASLNPGTDVTSSTKGVIYIDDDLKYAQDPRTYPSSNDYLGLVADNNIWVTNNTANNTGGCEIHATIMSRLGSFGAEDYDSRASAGSLRLLGGIIQERRGPVGTYSGSTINHGFRKVYSFDGRMVNKYPPFFPMTKQFKIYTWWE